MLAIQLRLKGLRSRRVRALPLDLRGRGVQEVAPSTLNIVGKSLAASMIVVLFSSFTTVFSVIDASTYFKNSPVFVRVIILLMAFQHMFTPLVYLAFFPQFRAVSFRCFEHLSSR